VTQSLASDVEHAKCERISAEEHCKYVGIVTASTHKVLASFMPLRSLLLSASSKTFLLASSSFSCTWGLADINRPVNGCYWTQETRVPNALITWRAGSGPGRY